MGIRSILAPVRGDGKGEIVLDHACSLAKRLGAHIDVIHARARPKDMLPFGVLMTDAMKATILDAAEIHAKDEEQRVRNLFDNYCADNGLKIVEQGQFAQDGSTISWIEKTGKQANLVGLYGRIADLVVVPKPDAELGINTLEAALMDAQVPTLMCPNKKPENLDNTIALAWNGSEQAARAIKRSMPILQEASTVYLMTSDEDGQTSGLSASDMQIALTRHGVDCVVHQLDVDHEIGQTLLDMAKGVRADMLVMGAYSHSRRRELVMGGATHYIINNARMPVLMLH